MDGFKIFMLFIWYALSGLGTLGTLMTFGSAIINDDEDSRVACAILLFFTGLIALPTLFALRH